MGREGLEESTEQEALLISGQWYVKNIVGSGFDKAISHSLIH
jgi:hypothetical protein